MQPIFIDIGFGLLAIVLALQGWRVGFVRTAGSLVGLIISVSLATWGVTWIEGVIGWHLSANPIIFVIAFLVITLILTKIMGMFIGILDLVRKIFQIIPGVGLVNSLLGLGIGLLQAGMVLIAVSFAAANFFPEGQLKATLLDAQSVRTTIDYMVEFHLL